MDYIEGETLDDLLTKIRHGRFPVAKVLAIGITLCNVLQYLHTRSPAIIFRDVKPANIMMSREGRLYLIDFGIARQYRPEQAKDTGPLGAPGYAAPYCLTYITTPSFLSYTLFSEIYAILL